MGAGIEFADRPPTKQDGTLADKTRDETLSSARPPTPKPAAVFSSPPRCSRFSLSSPTLVAHHRRPLELMAQIHATLAGSVLLAPFDIFAHTITAPPPDLLRWAIPAFLVDLFMLAVVIGLDANYLETAAT